MKHIDPEDYRISRYVRLSDLPTEADLKASKKELEDALEEVCTDLSKLQDTLYAHNRYSVLVCLQGMDTSGKDSLIREVFKYFNPRGVVVHSFKTPTSAELEHDYLWRHYLALPEKGKYAVFNRSHYENVLVTRVKPQYLLYENIPGIEKVEDVTPEFWEQRFEQIIHFEQHLAQNGIIVFKFFLHLSKEEQRRRLLRRLEEEKHNWKFSPGDLEDRKLWDQLQNQCIMAEFTSGPGPLYVPGEGRSLAPRLHNPATQDEPQPFIDEIIEWIIHTLIGSDDTVG